MLFDASFQKISKKRNGGDIFLKDTFYYVLENLWKSSNQMIVKL